MVSDKFSISEVRNTPVSNAVRLVLHVFVRLFFRVYLRMKSRGTSCLGGLRSSIIVANHVSHLDAFALFSSFSLGRVNLLRSLAAKDYFLRNRILRKLSFLFANIIPLKRGGVNAEAISYCGELLKKGYNLILFPEGTRSADGRINRFMTGVGLLSLKYNAPVIPAYIKGTYDSMKKGKLLPGRSRVEVVFGEKVDYTRLENRRENWMFLAEELEGRIKSLAQAV